MKVISKHNENLFYSIIGLPGSGTTLMSRVMNSIDGSSSLSDPLRSMISTLTNERLSEDNFEKPITNFMDGYITYAKSSKNEKILGIKEYFSPLPSRTNQKINTSVGRSDFIIFMLRDPLSNYNDWKRKVSQDKVKRYGNHIIFKLMYSQYLRTYEMIKNDTKCILIKYEDLCHNFSSEWLNEKFDGYLEFEGSLNGLKPLMGMGDIEAKSSYKINEPYYGIENLNPKEIMDISKLKNKYNEV